MTIFSTAIETELREVQQKATDLQKKASSLNAQVDQIIREKSFLKVSRSLNEHLERENKKELRKLLEEENIPPGISKEDKCKVDAANAKTDVDIMNSPTTTPSEDSETEKKYLELIDLLTVRMFDNEPEKKPVSKSGPGKKSSSLPRTLDLLQCQVEKSSSQHFSQASSGSGLTAYERLFGRPRPGEEDRTADSIIFQ